jgi:peptidoglycan/LPS O-acetylase OafA/YrhL
MAGAVIAVLVTRQDGLAVALLSARPVVYLGVVSYSWYLWQQAVLVPPGYYGFELPGPFTWPWNMLLTLALGVTSYELVEKRFMSHSKRRTSSRASA